MRKADRLSGLFWMFFSLFVSYHSYALGLGSLNQPGPGFLFFWTGVTVAMLSLAVVLRTFGRRPPAEDNAPFSGKWHVTKVASVLISLFLYALLMERLGFPIVTLLLFLFLLGIIEKKRPGLTVTMSFVVTAASYLLFEMALHSNLPKGLLEYLNF